MDPWLNHIPLPLVLKILVQTINSTKSKTNYKSYESLAPMICVAASEFPQECLKILEDLPEESCIWDKLLEHLKKKNPVSPAVLRKVYLKRRAIYEEHVIEVLKSFSEYLLTIETLDDNKKPSSIAYLTHECINQHTKFLTDNQFLSIFLSTISIDKQLLLKAISLINLFLINCDYSLSAIKTVTLFNLSMKSLSNNWLHKSELYCSLYELIIDPPCFNCNKTLQGKSNQHLEVIVTEIEMILTDIVLHDNLIKCIVCLHSEWIPILQKNSVIKSIFFNINLF